jgi:hypothetical protein
VESSSHETEIYVFLYLNIKIHQTLFNCALQNFKIDVDIAEKQTNILINYYEKCTAIKDRVLNWQRMHKQ